ncbi:unnamed protein product [Protopolystoma xenopodis]|uniref:OB domain-containing protein n=1 Tax=Protopolystoma xenopodis TaxID=117903 RepID=A0A3S5CCF5_9PLAT|nr:unnamed protein product [Protopolystoma xenopodis]
MAMHVNQVDSGLPLMRKLLICQLHRSNLLQSTYSPSSLHQTWQLHLTHSQLAQAAGLMSDDLESPSITTDRMPISIKTKHEGRILLWQAIWIQGRVAGLHFSEKHQLPGLRLDDSTGQLDVYLTLAAQQQIKLSGRSHLEIGDYLACVGELIPADSRIADITSIGDRKPITEAWKLEARTATVLQKAEEAGKSTNPRDSAEHRCLAEVAWPLEVADMSMKFHQRINSNGLIF